jgi:hypothetical protein
VKNSEVTVAQLDARRISLKTLRRTWALGAAFWFCLCVCVHVCAQTAPRKVTREEAIELAFDSIDPESRKLPGLTLEKYKEEHFPDFYAFEAIWDNPDPDGSTVVDLAVDPQTGGRLEARRLPVAIAYARQVSSRDSKAHRPFRR